MQAVAKVMLEVENERSRFGAEPAQGAPTR